MTIINWNEVNLSSCNKNDLPRENRLIYFIDDNQIRLGYIFSKPIGYMVRIPLDVSIKEQGIYIEKSLNTKKTFKWCYPNNVIWDYEASKKSHPKITTLLQARDYAGITQNEMSNLLGIPKRSIEDWESGRRSPAPWAERLIINELITIGNMKGDNMDYTINEYVAHKGISGIEDVSSQKTKFAAVGELRVVDFLEKEGFTVKFTKRAGYKDDITISKDGISLDWQFRVSNDKVEIKNTCKRLKNDFSQYRELVELRREVHQNDPKNQSETK